VGICFRILSLKTKDRSASSWLFDFVCYFLGRYKNENNEALFLHPICFINSTNSEPGIHGISKVIHYELQRLTLGEPESSLTGKEMFVQRWAINY